MFLQLAQFSSNEILSHKMRSHMERLRGVHRVALDSPETYLALRDLVDNNQFLLPARRLFHSVFQDLGCVFVCLFKCVCFVFCLC